MQFEYGRNFSGPAADVFHEGRVNADNLREAWSNNFLHPMFYHYSSPPSAEAMANRGQQHLPQPDHLLALNEDLETNFRMRSSKVVPLTSFLEVILKQRLEAATREQSALEDISSTTKNADKHGSHRHTLQMVLSKEGTRLMLQLPENNHVSWVM